MSGDDIRAFLQSLETEKEYFDIQAEKIVNAEIIAEQREGEVLAGIAGMYRMSGFPTLFAVVKKEYQGRGWGKKLVEAVRRKLIEKEIGYAILTVHQNNRSAVHVYRRCGFRRLGSIRGVYYMILPLTLKGHLLRLFLTIGFPVVYIMRRKKHQG